MGLTDSEMERKMFLPFFFLFCCVRYEGDKFVEEVRTDYVVWEETGRTDYGYTATMSEVHIMYQRNNCCSEH